MSLHSRVSLAIGVTTLVGLAVRWYYSSESTSGRSTLPTTNSLSIGQASVHPPITAQGGPGHAFASVQGAAAGTAPPGAVQVPNSVQTAATGQTIAIPLPAATAILPAPQLQIVQQPASLLAVAAGPTAVQVPSVVHGGAGQAVVPLLAVPVALQPAPQLQHAGRNSTSLRQRTNNLLAKMTFIRETTITVWLERAAQLDADDVNNACAGQLQNSLVHTALDVVATIEPSTEPDRSNTMIPWTFISLERLGHGFQKLRDADTHSLCRNLTVILPISKQLSSGRLSPVDVERIHPYCLPAVERLTWKSLSSQLPLIFGHNNSLRTLTLGCNLSANACAYILSNLPVDLEELEVSNIEVLNDDRDKRTDDDKHLTKNVNRVNIVSLKKLTMSTVFHPADVLNDFRFPALIEFTVHPNGLPIYRGHFSSIPWENIPDSNVTEKGFMPRLWNMDRLSA